MFENRRHILGWSCDVIEYIGHPEANFSIKTSQLGHQSNTVVIDKFYIKAGSQLVGGISASLGKRDTPIFFDRSKSYCGLLDWISTRPVIFYDVGDKRAWLSDGASALLHLVRASIDRDRNAPAYRSNWKFDRLPSQDVTPLAENVEEAIETLKSYDNLNSTLYIDDIIPNESGKLDELRYTFRDRVKEILHHFQILIDHQAQVAAQDGYRFQLSAKVFVKRLLGFDFWDIAKPDGPIRQRVHQLEAGGFGWVDYARTTQATVVFGNEFGELLQASNPKLLCPDWKTIPMGLEYMGTSIATLRRLNWGENVNTDKAEVTTGILWCSRYELFSSCGCTALAPEASPAQAVRNHVNPTQFLLPRSSNVFLDIPKECAPVSITEIQQQRGAVVFGHTPYIIIGQRLALVPATSGTVGDTIVSVSDANENEENPGSSGASLEQPNAISTSANSTQPGSAADNMAQKQRVRSNNRWLRWLGLRKQ
ncbi:unnamed protein product [Clonostachys rosea]|uniref:Heterokaryon incompatibility domain-containing protein n=1 Tax=Bionectria ochroleuca TaxID=29856 RepID=A0ABY6TYM1_BIOOC|nr:unnamed protein product [Clonostachys rosea]